MKREIKFRVWDDNLKVLYTPEMDQEIKNLWRIPNTQGGIIDYPNGTLMQYTGLKDKCGKEIYEGDICKNPDGIVSVVFEEGCFFVVGDNDCPLFVYSSDREILIEIIGNIYKNPELLEK